jgi:hypothetical protein
LLLPPPSYRWELPQFWLVSEDKEDSVFLMKNARYGDIVENTSSSQRLQAHTKARHS